MYGKDTINQYFMLTLLRLSFKIIHIPSDYGIRIEALRELYLVHHCLGEFMAHSGYLMNEAE